MTAAAFARFDGKVALVTAAASGICRASAEIIAAEGGTIAAVDNDRELLDGAMDAFAAAGARVIGCGPLASACTTRDRPGRPMSNHADETDDDDESMITPAMEAAIGREGDPVTLTITRELVRRMAEALDEPDPALLAALESDDATPEAPGWALFVHFGRYRQPDLPDAPPRGLMAADELTLLAPIHVGDELTVVSRIAGMNERIGGRVGHSLFVDHEWTFSNQHGVDVATTRRTVAYFKQKHSGA